MLARLAPDRLVRTPSDARTRMRRCDPLRLIRRILGAPNVKGFVDNNTEQWRWFVDINCEVPWREKARGGKRWAREQLNFQIDAASAKKLAMWAGELLAEIEKLVKKLPDELRRRLAKEEEADE